MKIKTSELTGAALDCAVAKALGVDYRVWKGMVVDECSNPLAYHDDWGLAGPIIERERIDFLWFRSDVEAYICAADSAGHFTPIASGEGPTPLIAAMRCFVVSRLGDEVEIPEELK